MIAQRVARWGALLFAPRTRRPLPVLERKPRAVGTPDRSNPNARRIVVTIETETFELIGKAAAAAGISQSEAIRQLIRRALDTAPSQGV